MLFSSDPDNAASVTGAGRRIGESSLMDCNCMYNEFFQIFINPDGIQFFEVHR